MRKYFIPVSVAILIGALLGKIFLEQYDAFNGIKVVSSEGESLYFIKYGVFDSVDDMEKNTMSLANYVYIETEGKYHVYIGITRDLSNLIKLNNHYSALGYKTLTEEFHVSNLAFLRELTNLDGIISGSDDEVVFTTISNLILEKYQELVIDGG